MFVLRRQKGESVMIGDDLMVTVSTITDASALVRVSRRALGGRIRAFEDVSQTWLKRDDSIPLGHDASCTLVDIVGDKVRLGLEAPLAVSVHRKEVYDAIQRENRRGLDDDDDYTIGSPVPR
ncbi:MAG: carbon storage regulator [Tepidisphaerales bacterium]